MDDSSLDNVETSSLDQSVHQPLSYPDAPTPPDAPPPQRSNRWIRAAIVLLAIALLVTAAAFIAPKVSRKKTAATTTKVTINTQTLDNGTLTKLVNQNAPNQAVKQQLVITPPTLFKDDVQVAKSLTVGGSSTLQGAVGINGNLAVRGSLSVGGLLSAGSLNVGSLNVTNINASGNLVFGGHLLPGGSAPTVKASTAAAGGSVAVSGNDTAGTITINMGNGQLVAGEFVIITFRTAFTTTPKVQLTPITPSSAGLNYYATRSASFFTIDTASMPAHDATYVFDYQVSQ